MESHWLALSITPYACPAWRWWFTHELGHALCAPTYICPRGSHIPILHSFREMLWEKVVVEDEAKEDVGGEGWLAGV